jgi:hypothetical protein
MPIKYAETGRRTTHSDPVHLESIHPEVIVPVSTVSGAELPIAMPSGVKSTGNSTTTPLAAGATFEGEWVNIAAYPAITINGGSDVPGTLYAEFNSTAATGGNVHRIVQLSSGLSGSFGIHGLGRVDTFFRVRLLNGATEQSSVEIETYLSPTPVIAQPTSRTSQVVSDYSDVLNVRNLTDHFLDEATSKQSDRQVVQKFGANPSVSAGTLEDIWYGGGIYTGFLTSASAIRIQAGGNTNDTAAGTGARSVVIIGLDENWEEASEEIATNGTSASTATTTTFIRVYRAYSADAGAYGGANTGDIVLETTGGIIVGAIEAAKGQTQLAIYTVPAGKSAFVRRVSATVGGSKAAYVYYYQRQDADVVSAPFTGKRLWFEFAELAGEASEEFKSYIGPFPAKTDIWTQALGPTGGAAISATFDIVLVPA